MWTIIGWLAITAGLVTAVSYGWRTYNQYKRGLDTTDEKKAIVISGGKASLGLLILIVGIKLLVGLFLLVAVLVPAASAAPIVVCDQQGCRQAVAPAPIVKNAKVARNIAARPNVIASKPVRVSGKRPLIKINRGLFGEALSPMLDYRAPLEACGYQVQYGSQFSSANDAYAVIGHSMGVFNALKSNTPRVFTIDVPFWAGTQTAPHAKTANFPTAGHPRVTGAVNVPIGGGHIGAPNQAKKYILAMLGCGTEPPRKRGA
jgi:hypothetical protein